MKRMMMSALAVVALAGGAWGSELRLAWQGQTADVRTIELAVGEQAVVEVHLDGLAAGDAVSGVFFSNELALGLKQVSVATGLAGWSVSSTPGDSLGSLGQQAAWASDNLAMVMDGPGDLLVGTLRIQAQSGNVGDEFAIAFDEDFTRVVDEFGAFFGLTATGSATQNDAGRFHLGAGSPGYTRQNIADVRDPLIVRIKAGSTGGGDTGGGGGGGGGGGDTGGGDGGGDTSGGDTGGGDTGGGDTGTNGTGGGDPGGGDSGTNGTGGGDTGGGDTGGGDTGGGDTGGGDTGGGDTGGGGTGGGDTGGGDTGGNDDGSEGSSPCGFGMVQMMPVMLLGLAGMRRRRSEA